MTDKLRIYNSLKSKKEIFTPLKKKKVGLYVCGMTVYDYCHIGHARILVVFDVIARHLRALGYDLTYVRNITDIDDKIIQRANEKGQTVLELTEFFIAKMNEDETKLGNQLPDIQPKATEHIDEIISMIGKLIEKKMAYISKNNNVYFHTRKFKNYGKLSKKNLEELRQGSRIEVDEDKKDALDFVLWKPAKDSEPSWSSPFGRGRPGWHIECSAMSCKHLGNTFDLHGGGGDLKFPHHENEIAQSQSATREDFAKGWIHVGFVNVENQKMSKSLNNFFTIREVFNHFDPEVVRYFLLSSHYRKPINYSDENLNLAKQGLTRLYGALKNNFKNTPAYSQPVYSYIKKFTQQMNDDFNTPNAVAVMFDLAKEINKQKELVQLNQSKKETQHLHNLQNTLVLLGQRLGILTHNPEIFFSSPEDSKIDSKRIEEKIQQRNKARAEKNFSLADEIRDELKEQGIILEDTSGQTIWRVL